MTGRKADAEREQEMRPLRVLLWGTGAVLILMIAISQIGGSFVGNGPRPQAVSPEWQVPGGNADRGERAIERRNCGACHTIGGLRNASARVGPLLTDYATQGYITGRMTNAPVNLVRWLQNPQSFEPGSVMPNLNIGDGEARDIAQYLYSDKNH